MPDKSTSHFLRVAAIMGLIISLFFAARCGWYIGLCATYAIWGKPADAVVEEVFRYYATIRKPRPTHYSPQFRGAYRFEIRMESGRAAHITGGFDTFNFVGLSKEEMHAGDRIAVSYLPFHPSWNRPVADFGIFKLIIAAGFFLVSFFSSIFLILYIKIINYQLQKILK